MSNEVKLSEHWISAEKALTVLKTCSGSADIWLKSRDSDFDKEYMSIHVNTNMENVELTFYTAYVRRFEFENGDTVMSESDFAGMVNSFKTSRKWSTTTHA